MAIEDRYWDSDCFLGWLAGETDKEAACRSVLRDAEAGLLRIVTSTLTLTEVIKLKKRTKLSVESQPKVDAFFKQPYIAVRQLDRRTAELARRMVWEHGFSPKDSVHVATAVLAKVEYLDSFDEDLIKKSRTIGNPPITIGHPYRPGQDTLALDGYQMIEDIEPL